MYKVEAVYTVIEAGGKRREVCTLLLGRFKSQGRAEQDRDQQEHACRDYVSDIAGRLYAEYVEDGTATEVDLTFRTAEA